MAPLPAVRGECTNRQAQQQNTIWVQQLQERRADPGSTPDSHPPLKSPLSQAVVVTPGNTVLVEGLSLEVPAGTNLLVTGPNGAGKSSLFRWGLHEGSDRGGWPHSRHTLCGRCSQGSMSSARCPAAPSQGAGRAVAAHARAHLQAGRRRGGRAVPRDLLRAAAPLRHAGHAAGAAHLPLPTRQ